MIKCTYITRWTQSVAGRGRRGARRRGELSLKGGAVMSPLPLTWLHTYMNLEQRLSQMFTVCQNGQGKEERRRSTSWNELSLKRRSCHVLPPPHLIALLSWILILEEAIWLQNTKHLANDASNDVTRPPLGEGGAWSRGGFSLKRRSCHVLLPLTWLHSLVGFWSWKKPCHKKTLSVCCILHQLLFDPVCFYLTLTYWCRIFNTQRESE